MKKAKFPLVILMIFILIINSGCWNRRELDELAILTACGIDSGQKKNEIKLISQIINPATFTNKGVNTNKTPFLTINASGKNIFEAARKSTREIARTLYFGHLELYIISSEVAKEKGIENLLDALYRDSEIREDINVLISKEQNTENLLLKQTTLEDNSGMAILKQLKNAHNNEGTTKIVELREVISSLMNPYTSLVLPTVFLSPPIKINKLEDIQSTKQKAVIKTSGYAIFNKDKLVGYLNPEEARALNFITDDIEGTVILIDYKNTYNTLEVVGSKTKIETKIENGKPKVLLDITIKGNVAELNAAVDLSKLSTIEELERLSSLTVNTNIKNLIADVQDKYQLDIFGFADIFEREHPKEWKQLEKDWKQHLADLQVDVKVNTKLIEVGLENNSFKFKMKEK